VFATLSTQQAGAVVEQARSARRLADLAAANQRRLAEAAAKREADAAVQRERAERDRVAAAERAAQARDDASRRRAEQQAEDARRAEAEARKNQRAAARQRDTATERAATFRTQGQDAARATGGNVGNALRSGQLGYKNAWQAANPRTDTEPDPKLIDDHAAQVAVRINRLFDSDHHKLAAALDELIRFRAHMSPNVAQTLARELSSLAARVEVYRTKLSSRADTAPNRDFDIEILDAEEVPEYATKEIER
jgi:membrane protein involved in colicin uptake